MSEAPVGAFLLLLHIVCGIIWTVKGGGLVCSSAACCGREGVNNLPNSRDFCNQEGTEHALVPPIIEVRDSLGTLAVQILAARKNLATMSYKEMLDELYDIVVDLHKEYDSSRPGNGDF